MRGEKRAKPLGVAVFLAWGALAPAATLESWPERRGRSGADEGPAASSSALHYPPLQGIS